MEVLCGLVEQLADVAGDGLRAVVSFVAESPVAEKGFGDAVAGVGKGIENVHSIEKFLILDINNVLRHKLFS